MIGMAEELGETVGVSEACRVLGVPRSSLYRARKPKPEPSPRPTPQRALEEEEKAEVRAVLNSERFCDAAPREVYATLLDEGEYYCHWRTMYRILEEHDEVHERRNQRRRPASIKPELRATGPNELWSWDGRPFGRLVNISLDMAHQ
jgi:putative transposase